MTVQTLSEVLFSYFIGTTSFLLIAEPLSQIRTYLPGPLEICIVLKEQTRVVQVPRLMNFVDSFFQIGWAA
jgi:hypothetical protein